MLSIRDMNLPEVEAPYGEPLLLNLSSVDNAGFGSQDAAFFRENSFHSRYGVSYLDFSFNRVFSPLSVDNELFVEIGDTTGIGGKWLIHPESRGVFRDQQENATSVETLEFMSSDIEKFFLFLEACQVILVESSEAITEPEEIGKYLALKEEWLKIDAVALQGTTCWSFFLEERGYDHQQDFLSGVPFLNHTERYFHK